MSKLVDGKIPAFTKCPFDDECPLSHAGQCGHTGIHHRVDFSCGAARSFDVGVLRRPVNNDQVLRS